MSQIAVHSVSAPVGNAGSRLAALDPFEPPLRGVAYEADLLVREVDAHILHADREVAVVAHAVLLPVALPLVDAYPRAAQWRAITPNGIHGAGRGHDLHDPLLEHRFREGSG